MENVKDFFRLFISPASAMSNIIDRGSWIFAVVLVRVVAAGFYSTINLKLAEEFRFRSFQEFYQPNYEPTETRLRQERPTIGQSPRATQQTRQGQGYRFPATVSSTSSTSNGRSFISHSSYYRYL